MRKGFISILLILAMISTNIPVRAVENGINSLSSDIKNKVSENSLIIPIESHKMDKRLQTVTNSVYSTVTSLSEKTKDAYVPIGVTSFTVNEIGYFDSSISSSARVQVVDSNDEVIATTDGKDLYSSSDANGNYITNAKFFCLQEIPIGEHSLQLVDNFETTLLENRVIVIPEIILENAYISELSQGSNDFYISLELSNFTGFPEDFSVQLIDENDDIVAADISHKIEYKTDSGMYVQYLLRPTTDIVADALYSGVITYNGDGTVVSNIDTVERRAVEIPNLMIDEIVVLDASQGILAVSASYTRPLEEYIITIIDSDEEIIYQDIQSPDKNGTFNNIQIKKYGLALPLSEYNNFNIEVKSNVNQYNYDNFYFYPDTDYSYFPKHISIFPKYISVDSEEMDF
ncbi:MAG: hypothetical protein AB7G87_09245, partial [Clostridia bacterium]